MVRCVDIFSLVGCGREFWESAVKRRRSFKERVIFGVSIAPVVSRGCIGILI
jgi:hypothetical protein